MEKKGNLIWRVVAVAVLLCALVPVAFSTGAEAATAPVTHLNPVPQYLSDITYPLIMGNLTGTARVATGRSLAMVTMQIKYTHNATTYYWDGTTWTWTESFINTSNVTASLWTPQYDFYKDDQLPVTSNLTDGYTYTIIAQAADNAAIKDSTGSSRSFIYDTTHPVNGNFTAVGNANVSNLLVKWNASTLNTITGVCSDTTPGKIAKVQVSIWQDSNDNGAYDTGEYSWDGTRWIDNGATPAIVTASLTGTTTWTLSTTSVAWTHNASYGVSARAIDWTGNEAAWVSHNFLYAKSITSSSTVPVINIDTLPAYFQSASLQAITGVANASVNKSINISAVNIQDNTNGYWWNGSAFTTTDENTWLNATEVNGSFDTSRQVDWSFDTSAVIWTSGNTYKIKAKAVQNLSGTAQQTITSPQTVICDDVAPVTDRIIIPVQYTYLGDDTIIDSLTSVRGTCADTTGGSADGLLNSVQIRIQNIGTGYYWSGTTWDSAVHWLTVSGTTDWTLNTELVTWEHMNYYQIIARGEDSAGNIESPTTAAEFVFVRDLDNPVTPTPTPTSTPTINTTIGNISDYVLSLTAINGTADASSTVTGVLVQINRSSDRYCWNGISWLNASIWIAATATGGAFGGTTANWTINASTTPDLPEFVNGSTYYIYAKAYSGSTNDSTPATEHFTIGVAPTPTPTPTLTPTPTPTPVPTPTPTPSMTASGTIGASGGILTTSDGKIKITFPAGAFATNQIVTIAPSTCKPSEGKFTVGTTCFKVTPDSALDAAVTICVKYSATDKSRADGDTTLLTLGYYGSDSKWHECSNVEVTSTEICGTTSHLSDWAVLVKEKSEGWAWYYWVLIGIGGLIVLLAIVLLVVLPKRRDQGDVPSDSLVDDQF